MTYEFLPTARFLHTKAIPSPCGTFCRVDRSALVRAERLLEYDASEVSLTSAYLIPAVKADSQVRRFLSRAERRADLQGACARSGFVPRDLCKETTSLRRTSSRG